MPPIKQAARRAFMNAKDKVARVMMVVDTISNENTPEEVLHLLSTSEVARAAQPFATRSLASVQAAGDTAGGSKHHAR